MSDATLAHAKEHLEELVARTARGEEVRIVDPAIGSVRLTPDVATAGDSTPASKQTPQWDLTAARVTDTMPKFVPLSNPRVLDHLKGVIPPPPEGFFDPLTEEELKDWYGE